MRARAVTYRRHRALGSLPNERKRRRVVSRVGCVYTRFAESASAQRTPYTQRPNEWKLAGEQWNARWPRSKNGFPLSRLYICAVS